MSGNWSFKLRYVGARFVKRRLPVDVLTDLPAFRELLVAFAKAEWRRLNEGRKRVPTGFYASLAFDLVGIEDGSAVPCLEWNREATQECLPGFTDQIEDIVAASFDRVVRLFAEASFGRFPATMAPEEIRALNKLGANLRDDERIEFNGTENAEGKVVYLSQPLRKHLLSSLRDKYVLQITDVATLLGAVKNPDHDFGHIRVRSDRYGIFDVPIDNETIKQDFDGSIDQPLELSLTVQLNHEDRVTSVTDVRNVSLVDEQIAAHVKRCKDRLLQLSSVGDRWHDGVGIGPSAKSVAAANDFLGHRLALSAHYRIYPTEEGGILFEFEIKGWDYSVEFLTNGHVKIFGIEIRGEGTTQELIFPAVNADFLAEFDNLTAR